MWRVRGYWVLAVLAALASGCGEELGPERFQTAQVRGSLRLGSKPVGPGWVQFLPVEGTRGNLRIAPLAADGSFTAEGVAVGRNQIGVVVPGDRSVSEYFHPLSPRVRRNIPAGRSTLAIDFLTEAVASSPSR